MTTFCFTKFCEIINTGFFTKFGDSQKFSQNLVKFCHFFLTLDPGAHSSIVVLIRHGFHVNNPEEVARGGKPILTEVTVVMMLIAHLMTKSQDCPPQDSLLGGQPWGGQFWVNQDCRTRPDHTDYHIVFIWRWVHLSTKPWRSRTQWRKTRQKTSISTRTIQHWHIGQGGQ